MKHLKKIILGFLVAGSLAIFGCSSGDSSDDNSKTVTTADSGTYDFVYDSEYKNGIEDGYKSKTVTLDGVNYEYYFTFSTGKNWRLYLRKLGEGITADNKKANGTYTGNATAEGTLKLVTGKSEEWKNIELKKNSDGVLSFSVQLDKAAVEKAASDSK